MNMVDEETNQSAFRTIWSSLQSTCDTVHCLGERTFFFFI